MVVYQIVLGTSEDGKARMEGNILAREDATDDELATAKVIEEALLEIVRLLPTISMKKPAGDGHAKIRKS